ncbi:hypothetical protein EMCRGX_G015253 [Ephydatia muelleri]
MTKLGKNIPQGTVVHNNITTPFACHSMMPKRIQLVVRSAWGDVITRHNRLRDEVFDLCHHAHLSVSVERGHGLTRVLPHTRPANTLIAGWDRGKPAALDLSITSPPCSAILSESCHQAGAAALAAEACKLHSNGPKCQELGWSCIPW